MHGPALWGVVVVALVVVTLGVAAFLGFGDHDPPRFP